MSTDGAHCLREVRDAVSRYLSDRPDAADTPAGIAQWWLPVELRDVPLAQLREVLAELVAAREVRCTVLPDGSELFSRAVDKDGA
jgi:hypothetical protein